MAYLIFNSENDLVKIAANDTEKNSLNINLSDYVTKDVSDADFNKVKLDTGFLEFDGTNVTIADRTIPADYNSKEAVDETIANLKKILNEFLSVKSNSENSRYTECKSYYDYLNGLDTSSMTFPLGKTWEQYCSDNSIPFINPLQIP